MYPKKKDYTIIIVGIFVGIPAVVLLSAVFSYAACPGCTLSIYLDNLDSIFEILNKSSYGLKNPGIYKELSNEFTGGFVIAGLFIYAFIALYAWAGQKNYIRGKEYGTDKYANVAMVNNRLKDPDKNNIYHYHYEKYDPIEKIKANIKCEVIKQQKRHERRKRGIAD